MELSQKSKGRKFFQQLQPTFSIDVAKHNITKLEFLDHSDPGKDTVVRKKAREWVNRNKEILKKRHESQSPKQTKSPISKDDDATATKTEPQQIMIKMEEPMVLAEPLHVNHLGALDPFDILPSREMVGRKYEHIIQFFFYGCPEEIPCSDDKYSDKSKYAMIPFSWENTVFGNMARSDATFILWLYATVSIRDGMTGNVDTEEVRYFYHKSLEVLQQTLKKEADAGEYSDHLLNCLACIAATASFSGMFKTAEIHRDALVRVLRLRGNGDIIAGLSTAVPWTVKAIQWCEIMVATQLIQLPHIPYIAQRSLHTPPPHILDAAAAATSHSLTSLPPLSEPFHRILHLMHLLGLAYARTPQHQKIDDYIIQPLYDVEYALLRVLESQKLAAPRRDSGNAGYCGKYDDVEVLLAESLQLYFWTGPRMLPPQTRLCDLLVTRTRGALLRLLGEKDGNMGGSTSSPSSTTTTTVINGQRQPPTVRNAIIWSLALGTVVSASPQRPEHIWFAEQLMLQLQLSDLNKKNGDVEGVERGYENLLRSFPTTEGFRWIDLAGLFARMRI